MPDDEYTVGTLRARLATLPDDMKVVAWCDEYEAWLPVLSVSVDRLTPDEEVGHPYLLVGRMPLPGLPLIKTHTPTVNLDISESLSKARETTMDDAYIDRNLLAQLCAVLAVRCGWPVSWAADPQEPEWPVLLIEMPTGQISYHIPRAEASVAAPWAALTWDGHSTEEKRTRIGAMLLCIAQHTP